MIINVNVVVNFRCKKVALVILYETINEASSSNKNGLVTVISEELVCSKVPVEYLCDVELLRERVRSRRLYTDDEQSFDL